MNERTGIGELKGIGEKTEKLFHRLGVYTVGDLLRHYPRGYDIYEAPVPIDDLTEGRIQTVSGLLSGAVQVSPNRKMPVTTVKGCIRDYKSNMVPDAFFKEHIGGRWTDYSAWTCGAEKRWSDLGAS